MTEAEAVAELSLRTVAGAHNPIDADEVVTILVPDGYSLETVDGERYADQPHRSRGTVRVHDAASFAHVVQLRLTDEPAFPVVVYADEEAMQLVGILNDDQAGEPGWRDHRVELSLRRRPEWEHWVRGSGRFFEQEAFAAHIEEGLPELVTPSAADMLDLAQTFQAQTSGRFKQSGKLASGEVQFMYEEEIDAQAGVGGTLAIPEVITLGIAPFFGSAKYEVTARFRFRLKSGDLTLGYVLDRPLEVERTAFAEVRDSVGEALSTTVVAGPAPSAVTL